MILLWKISHIDIRRFFTPLYAYLNSFAETLPKLINYAVMTLADGSPETSVQNRSPDTSVASLNSLFTEANNKFTARMFDEVVKGNRGKSVVLSAFSVLTPLAQLALGSVGPSHDELLRALSMPNDNVTKAVFAQINNKMQSVHGVELNTASCVYIPEGVKLSQHFESVSRTVFKSEVKQVDFSKSEKTAATINKWVEQQTSNRIKNMVSPRALNPDTRTLLVNAIYFKGLWETPFKEHLTKEGDFYVTKNKIVKVPIMFIRDRFDYIESKELDAKLLRLPYKGGKASMLIILPKKKDGLDHVIKMIKRPSVLAKATETMLNLEVEVELPRFKIETTTDLASVLQKINVKKIFNHREAKLDRILKDKQDLYVSAAYQKAFIEVNEGGTEAGAANVVSGGAGPLNIMEFDAKWPFYFEITAADNRIFNGVYKGPTTH